MPLLPGQGMGGVEALGFVLRVVLKKVLLLGAELSEDGVLEGGVSLVSFLWELRGGGECLGEWGWGLDVVFLSGCGLLLWKGGLEWSWLVVLSFKISLQTILEKEMKKLFY